MRQPQAQTRRTISAPRWAGIAAVCVCAPTLIVWTAHHENETGGASPSEASMTWFNECRSASNFTRENRRESGEFAPADAADTLIAQVQSKPEYTRWSRAVRDAALAGIRAGVTETC